MTARPTPDDVIAVALAADLADFYEGSKYDREPTNDNTYVYVEEMTDDERRCRRVNNAHAGESLIGDAIAALFDLAIEHPKSRERCRAIREILRKADARFERIRELDGE